MDNRAHLESLTKNFSTDGLVEFLRKASGKFKPEKEDLRHYLDDGNFVRSLHKLGKIEIEGGQRLIVLVGALNEELTSHSGKVKQYEIAKRVLKQEKWDAGIFVFHDNKSNFRFSWIMSIYGAKREFTGARRYTYFVSPEASARTFVEQIGRADFSNVEKITEAFSVEPVTKEFFRQFREIFEEAEATIKLKWSEEKKRLYTQRFFNRVLFITFLERKGWLTFNGRKDYLRALIEDYAKNQKDKNANFHRSRLNTLFFMGLNHPSGDKRQKAEYKPILSLIGDVPYLNGGLFEEEEDDKDGPTFPDGIIAKVLNELVYQFNFTVTESTPLDVEVAVDPEMLGRIFEELVTGRHESGSYYTPKPVVAFMCREALKGYLATALPAESAEGLALFVDKNDAKIIRNPMQMVDALRAVKVCDPACGSGAYLLGMLHELLEQYAAIFSQHQKDAPTIYQRKLEIIQNNLYGVDKDDFAVNIARLRLWLSLIVDFEGGTPPPLPNLDFKIECGDSLTAPDPSGGLNLASTLVDSFLEAKNDYGKPHPGEKRSLLEKIDDLRNQIQMWAGRSKDFKGFDWVVEFAELFVASKRGRGFDIILANPPYVRADAQFKHIEDEEERQEEIAEWQTFRKQLKDSKIYKTLHEKWDLYIPFLERAYQLLRQNGQMVFIIPDAYNAAKYASKSHEFFLQNTNIERIDFCSEINLFDAGVNNTILHYVKVAPNETSQPVRARRWGENKDEFETNLELLETAPQLEFGVELFRYDSKFSKGAGDNIITLDKVCYMSKGMVIHADERQHLGAFKTDDLISQVKDKIHPKAFIQGRDIAKWVTERIQFLEWGTKRAPSMFRRPTFPELYNVPEKLITMDIGGQELKVLYDNKQLLHNHSGSSVVPWHYLKGIINKSINKTSKYKHQDPLGDREEREEISHRFNLKYVLAVMNSSFARTFVNKRRRSKLNIYPDDWKKLPIAPIPLEEQKEFVKLVDKILGEYEKQGYPLPEKSAEKVREWEGQLDEMVGKLYE